MTINPVAAGGFSSAAGIRAQVRPSYARGAIGEVKALCGRGATVVDLAAGTGILTGQLARSGLTPVAVDPLPAMLAHLRSTLPAVPAALGVADALPLRSESAHGCTVGQALHWFDAPSSLDEVARVLTDDAPLMVLFNAPDESLGWVREIDDVAEQLTGGRPWVDRRAGSWPTVIAETGLFSDVAELSFANAVPTTSAGVLDRLRSTSSVAALAAADREALLEEARRAMGKHPELIGTFDYPHRTRLMVARRRRR